MSDILLGIDIGTSACKVMAFDKSGKVVASKSKSYPVYYPNPGWVEQNPDEWWDAVCVAIKQMIDEGLNASEIKGVGIDGQSWSAIAVDKEGNVLCNNPIWMDLRSQDICTRLKETIGEERLFNTSGNPLQPSYTLPKILWYKENRPDVYEKTYKILQSNSFIAYRLTGHMTQEPSQGYGLSCYDIRKNVWDIELCKELGINPDFLPEIVQCHDVVGSVTEKAAQQTGLLVGTPVVAGGLDAACGTLGVGVIHAGETQEQGGQAGGMSICMDTCLADKRLILGCHVVPGYWLLQGGTVGGGGVINWFEKEFCEAERIKAKEDSKNSFEEMSDEATTIPAGSEGLVFLPYMSGERSPIWDPCAKGVYFGIDFSKTRAHFIRASMEGVAYSLKHNLETAKEAGANAEVLRAMGGAANSTVWTQLKADITGRKIIVPASDTATALGAAILAGVGVGIYKSFEEAVDTTIAVRKEYTPNPEVSEVYEKGYKKYIDLYKNLKSLMSEV